MTTHEVDEDKGGTGRADQDALASNASPSSGREAKSAREPLESRHERGPRQSPQATAPSLLGRWVVPGVVALVCGIAGAWAYGHFFSPAKTDKQGEKNAEALHDAQAQEEVAKGEVHQAEAEWKTAMDEVRQAQTEAAAARYAQEDTQKILDFLRKNLLSAGRAGDVSLTAAFWAENPSKDVTLRQAVDVTESRVAEAFADRPAAEAAVREMIGLAYLNLRAPQQSVKEYERALALREGVQGINDAETAACRNQLAVAYRLAGRIDAAARLFDRNENSLTHASALAIRGTMLLVEKNAVEAELKLRAALKIRQKSQPDDWTTFDTMSLLGEALTNQRKFAEAEAPLIAGYEGMKQREKTISAHDRPRLTIALERLVRLYEAWDKRDKAMQWRAELHPSASPKK